MSIFIMLLDSSKEMLKLVCVSQSDSANADNFIGSIKVEGCTYTRRQPYTIILLIKSGFLSSQAIHACSIPYI